jgi:pyrroline-5-carboxylate reductase
MKIAVIGGGNMGYAFSKSFIDKGLITADELVIVEKNEFRCNFLRSQGIAQIANDFDGDIALCDFVILAVKPQSFAEVAQDLKQFVTSNQTIISIMAGVSIETINQELGCDKIVRVMPNTPALIGEGVSGYFISGDLSIYDKDAVRKLLKSCGGAVEVDSEKDINAVTAISGSGPAYFFNFVKLLIESGTKLGIEEEKVKKLVLKTMKGSYELMKQSNDDIQTLMDNVTSKGGTTQAALDTFKEYHLGETIDKAITSANNRADELSKM